MKGLRRWRWIGWIALTAATSGCTTEYTAAPTPCDDWCHATLRADCEGDKPHECVLDCESKSPTSCAAARNALSDCYLSANDEDFYCEGENNAKSAPKAGVCQAQHDALFACEEPVLYHCLTTCADRAVSAKQTFEDSEHDATTSWTCPSLNDDCLCACYTLDFLGTTPTESFFDCLESAAISKCALGADAPKVELSGGACKPPGVFASCSGAE